MDEAIRVPCMERDRLMATARVDSPAFETVISRFQEIRNEQTAAVLARRNPGVLAWDVKFGDLEKIIKPYKASPGRSALARKLWKTGVPGARSLALMLIEPQILTVAEIDRWVEEVDFPYLADTFAGVVYKTPFRDTELIAWTRRPEESVHRARFALVYNAAADPRNPAEDALFRGYLGQVEREIHASANWAREMMDMVPITIGKRNDAL